MTDVNVQRMSAKKRGVRFILPILVLGLAVGGFVFMGKLKPKPVEKNEPPKAAPVVTAEAQGRSLALNVQAQGEVRPKTEVNISTQLSGRIAYLATGFIEGGQFKKGDVLVRIEAADYNLRVTQAQANVAQAQTALTRELSEVDIAKQDWKDLGEGQASPLTLRAPQLAEARARLDAVQASLDEAKLQQSRTVIRAPFNGRVKTRLFSTGEYVVPGQVLGRAFATETMEAKIPLTDTDLARLDIGIGFQQTAKLTGPDVTLSAIVAGAPRSWQGKLVRTDSGFDTETRVLFGYVEVRDPYGAGADEGVPLAAGLFVNAAIVGKDIEDSVVVPRTALRGTDTVFVAQQDNTLAFRTVTVASSSRREVVLTGGLRPGELVVVSPVKAAADGMRIEIAKPVTDGVNAVSSNQ